MHDADAPCCMLSPNPVQLCHEWLHAASPYGTPEDLHVLFLAAQWTLTLSLHILLPDRHWLLKVSLKSAMAEWLGTAPLSV